MNGHLFYKIIYRITFLGIAYVSLYKSNLLEIKNTGL